MDQATSEVWKSEQAAGPASLTPSDQQWSGTVGHRLAERSPTQPHREWNIRNILVPTDYSAVSDKAIQRAVIIANQCDAAITILHVIDINAQAELGTAQNLMERLWSDASRRMANLAFSLTGQVHAKTMLTEGLPWEVITEKSGEFDLVVLAKAQRATNWSLFSKHTASRVIKNATCPVMVVRE